MCKRQFLIIQRFFSIIYKGSQVTNAFESEKSDHIPLNIMEKLSINTKALGLTFKKRTKPIFKAYSTI